MCWKALTKPPTFADLLREHHPAVADGFQAMRKAARESGPIDAKHRELIMLAGFAAAGIEGGFRVHTRIALENGATAEEINQTVLFALGAAQGLSPSVEALRWAREVIAEPR